MPSRKSASSNTRNMFDNAHGAGKGDKSRVSDPAKYVANFPETMGTGPVRKFRKVYGVTQPKPITIEQLPLPDSFEEWSKSPSFIIH